MDENRETLSEALSRGFDSLTDETAEPVPETPVQETPVVESTENVPTEEQPQAETMEQTQPVQPQPVEETPAMSNDQVIMQNLIEELQRTRQANAQLQQMVQQQNDALYQQSNAANESAAALVEQPTLEIPVLNFRDLQYMDEEDANKLVSDWQNGMTAKIAEQLRAEIAPVKADYEEKRRLAELNNAKNAVYGQSQFADFKDNDSQIERIISQNGFENFPPEQRYLLGGLIARGMNQKEQSQPTTDDIIRMATSNPDVMKAIAVQNAQQVQSKQNNIPTLVGTNGLSSANAIPEQRVRTREELESRLNAAFGL